MPENIEISPKAYCKIILHSAKYPHCAINGILLSKIQNNTKTKELSYEDVIPLFHIDLNLTPMAEIALAQIDELVSKNNLCIGGYYVAHENLRDNSIEKAECRISDKITSNFNHPCIFVVDNTKLSIPLSNIALKVAQYSDGHYRQCDSGRIHLSNPQTIDVCSRLLEEKKFEILNDFDDHLDDVKCDWMNYELNKEIENMLNV